MKFGIQAKETYATSWRTRSQKFNHHLEMFFHLGIEKSLEKQTRLKFGLFMGHCWLSAAYQSWQFSYGRALSLYLDPLF